MRKRPEMGVQLRGGKRPAIAALGEASGRRPVWRFGLIDHNGPYPWDWDAFVTHFPKLMDLEGKPWDEFVRDGTVGAKSIPLAGGSYKRAALNRLERLKLDDVDALWELRMGGAPRFWGIRDLQCFHFLWWDPEHKVCPSKRDWDN